MRKSNVVIFALLAACSVFLLWLWYFLGFDRVDYPFDLVLTVVWWAVIAVAVALVARAERIRRRHVRTVYVGKGAAFNSEKGLVSLAGESPVKDELAAILEGLKYDFTCEGFPEQDEFEARYLVRTREFEPEKGGAVEMEAAEPASRDQKTWRGEVLVVETKEERLFDTPEELGAILASLGCAA